MRHAHSHHTHRQFPVHHAPDDRRGHGPRRGGRAFDYGGLRLVVLSMIAEQPRHGYQLMKAIEERMGGGYSPSPGVIYPTLSWLEDMGYAAAEIDGSRKQYRITPEGEAFLVANRDGLAELAGRIPRAGRPAEAPEPVIRAMDGLKRALRGRFGRGAPDEETVGRIAAAIDTATRTVEALPMTETVTLTSSATVATPKAAGYLAQLCKHFGHKVPASHEGNDGQISFSSGTCRLHAEEAALTMTVEAATPEDIARLEEVVASHLLRFAFREELKVEWLKAAA